MAININAGSKENVLVDLVDKTGAVTDITSLSPKYTLDKPDDTHVYNAATATVSGFASGTLTSDTTNVSDGHTVTIDGVTYTFRTALGNDITNEVLIGATYSDSLINLKAAINLASGAGSLYDALTVVHPTVVASGSPGSTLTITAKVAGAGGNLISTTENSTHLSFGAATLTGGTGPDGTMTFVCFIDTTSGNPSGVALVKGTTYKLYVSFTVGSEVPKLGKIDVTVV